MDPADLLDALPDPVVVVDLAATSGAGSSRSVVPNTDRSTAGSRSGHVAPVRRTASARVGTPGSWHVGPGYDRPPCR